MARHNPESRASVPQTGRVRWSFGVGACFFKRRNTPTGAKTGKLMKTGSFHSAKSAETLQTNGGAHSINYLRPRNTWGLPELQLAAVTLVMLSLERKFTRKTIRQTWAPGWPWVKTKIPMDHRFSSCPVYILLPKRGFWAPGTRQMTRLSRSTPRAKQR